MAYLYGDSTPSDLAVDYIDFLRDALDFSAQILAADERMRAAAARAIEVGKQSDIEVTRLEALGAVQAHAIDGYDAGTADSPTAQCAQALLRGAADTVRQATERVRAAAAGDVAKLEEEAKRDRERCVEALGAFLREHDLPGMTSELRLQQFNGVSYAARLYVKGLDGLMAALELEVPSGHLFAAVPRVDKLVERLEVHAPESGGWLRKEVKLRAQRLDKEFITAFVAGAHESLIHLRAASDGSGVGFDLSIKNGARVKLSRIGEAGDLPPFDLDETDSAKVRELRDELLAATNDLRGARKAVVEAMLGDTPLKDHHDPKIIVERLVAVMAPVVREIAKRSLAPTELVLKRQMGDGRREEIFVSRRDLQLKLRHLGAAARAVFKPLELGELPPEELAKADKADAGAAKASEKPAEKPVEKAPEKAADKAPEKAPEKKRPGLFADALAVDRAAQAAMPPPGPAAKKDEVVPLKDDSLERLIVSEATEPKPQ